MEHDQGQHLLRRLEGISVAMNRIADALESRAAPPIKHPLVQINAAGGYIDFEGALLTAPGLLIDLRLSVPAPGEEAERSPDETHCYISLHIGDEHDAYAHHNGEPETFPIPWAVAKALLLRSGYADLVNALPDGPDPVKED